MKLWTKDGQDLRIDYGKRSDRGGRRDNQDNMQALVDEKRGLYCFVVADGLGGHQAGQVASEIAVTTIIEFFSNVQLNNIHDNISQALLNAHNIIRQKGGLDYTLNGMKSTCVLLVIAEGKAYWASIGDSRIYVFRKESLVFKSKDHSVVQLLVDMGKIAPEEAKGHPDQNRILKTLGMEDEPKAAISTDGLEIRAGDYFILCTDGIWQRIEDRELYGLSLHYAAFPAQYVVNKLFDKAYKRGQKTDPHFDNLTLQLIMVK